MAPAIGLRFYRMQVLDEKKKAVLNEPQSKCDLFGFLEDQINAFEAVSEDSDRERGWYFVPTSTNSQRNLHGLIRYGTYGFESDLIDRKTRKKKYQRQPSDLEEIPLYYQFWVPVSHDFGLVAFQSFQGRSCVSLVTSALREAFEKKFKGYRLIFRKLMPEDVAGSALASAPVKQITLVKKSVSGDIADSYIPSNVDQIDYEVTFKAKRRRNLGDLLSIRKKAIGESKGVVLTHHGEQFDELKAEITFGKRRRVVGVFGIDRDAGVIEIGDAVKRSSGGHPDLSSIEHEVDQLMQDFYEAMVAKG